MSSSARSDRPVPDRSTDRPASDLSVDHDRDAPGEQANATHRTAPSSTGAVSAENFGLDRSSVTAREKEQYGGVKVGSAFFGWLTATGTAVLLTGLLAAVGTAVGFATETPAADAADSAGSSAQTAGLVGAIVLLVVLLIAYFCGGYVAGRMARFNGVKQGIAVWVWALVIAVVVAVLGLIAGDRFDVVSQLSTLPQLPVSTSDLTTGGIVALLAVAATSLIGAILGGLAGMRFHRKVDRAGLGH